MHTTPFGYVHLWPQNYEPDFSATHVDDRGKLLLIHELTHVWQYQQGYPVASSGTWLHLSNGFDEEAIYSVPSLFADGWGWDDFDIEKQGVIVERYWLGLTYPGYYGRTQMEWFQKTVPFP